MQNCTHFRLARIATLLVASCCAALTPAQSAPSAASSSANDTWLKQTANLYYSSSKAGLKGFDCAVQTDWQALYATQNGGQVSAADGAKVALLNSVKMTLHALMAGGSTLDWIPPDQQIDASQSTLLNDMHSALNQTVMGFMQFWTPFIDGSVVPDSSTGLEMTATADGGEKIHLAQPSLELSEAFDSGSILREYDVTMSGTKVNVAPSYSPSDHGLLITHFHAMILSQDNSQQAQEMNVEVTYQWLDGFPIPAHLVMEVTGVATLHMALNSCTVQR